MPAWTFNYFKLCTQKLKRHGSGLVQYSTHTMVFQRSTKASLDFKEHQIMLENLSDNFPQRQQEFRCYLDRRKQTPIHTYWKSSFGTIIFSEEFYKLLVKGLNKCCNKVRPVLTSFLIVYALTPMLLLLSRFSHVQLFVTLWTIAYQASFVHGIL